MKQKQYTLNEKVDAVIKFVKHFWPERFIHLVLMAICIILILVFAAIFLVHKDLPWTSFLAIFLPSGAVGFLSSRVLAIFTACLNVLKEEIK